MLAPLLPRMEVENSQNDTPRNHPAPPHPLKYHHTAHTPKNRRQLCSLTNSHIRSSIPTDDNPPLPTLMKKPTPFPQGTKCLGATKGSSRCRPNCSLQSTWIKCNEGTRRNWSWSILLANIPSIYVLYDCRIALCSCDWFLAVLQIVSC